MGRIFKPDILKRCSQKEDRSSLKINCCTLFSAWMHKNKQRGKNRQLECVSQLTSFLSI